MGKIRPDLLYPQTLLRRKPLIYMVFIIFVDTPRLLIDAGKGRPNILNSGTSILFKDFDGSLLLDKSQPLFGSALANQPMAKLLKICGVGTTVILAGAGHICNEL